MTTFTPGPWTAHKNEVEGEVVIHGLPATFFVTSESERGGWVAEVMLDTTDEANARLIAAAPDLLATLEALLDDVEYAQPQIEPGLIGNRQIRKARAAIAKAKGE